MNLIVSHKRWRYFWLLVSLSLIFIATISPFNFVIPDQLSWQSIARGFTFGSNLKDYWQNILLFIPLGFSLSIVVANQQKQARIILIIGFFLSAILSTTVELTQFFLPTRVSNLTDIIYNTAGGTVGSFIYCIRVNICLFISAIITGNFKRLSYQDILMAIAGYCLMIGLLFLILLFSVNLNNWSENYYLVIGNEVNGGRPWNGYINSFYLSDRGLDTSEVIETLAANNTLADESNLIVALNFSDYQLKYQDKSQKIPDLLWQTEKLNSNTSTSIFENINLNNQTFNKQFISVNSQQWLKTKNPATYLNNRLKDRDEFTISLNVATTSLNQGGPARILSLSEGTNYQNMIIGQKDTDLHFRLRTPITGRNPVYPEFVIPNVFNDLNFHQILITFKDSKLNFYIDQAEHKYAFNFNPCTSFTVFIPWDNPSWSVNLGNFPLIKHQLGFYSTILVPLLFFISLLIVKFI
jgi:hypothetical protein